MPTAPRHVYYLLLLSLLVLPLSSVHGQNADESSTYHRFAFTLNNVADRIVPIDANNDGLTDLITSKKQHLSIYFQTPIDSENVLPFNFSKADLTLELPGKAAGWDLDWNTQSESPKAIRIVALIDGQQVVAWPIEHQQLGEQQLLVDGLAGNLPLGAYPLDFVRDINDDQRNDFIIPGADQHRVFLQDSSGEYKGGIQIKSNLWIQSTLSVENELTRKVGQAVTIPNIRIRDVNGDGYKDLISEANELLEVFLAKTDGSYPAQPNYHYDFSEIQERLGEPSFEDIDFSNLSSMTRYSYNFTLDDITGDGIDDLLIREAGKVIFYRGTATGMDLQQPQQVLRSGGNVFGALLLDEDKDKRKDLWLVRIEDISLGKAFVWLALSGSINIEAFIYRNEGERFARRPHNKKTVKITFPSLLKSLSLTREIEDKAEATDVTRTHAARLSGTDADNDLLVLDQHGIRVYLDTLEQQLSDEEMFLGLIDDVREKDEFTVDLTEILSNVSVQGQQHLAQVEGQSESYTLSLGGAADDLEPGSDLLTLDLNSDERDDILLLTQRQDDSVKGVLYLSK